MLWNGGISFGGVVSFLFADLIIVPILIIYRKYYGTRMMLILLGVFYATMVLAGYLVEFSSRCSAWSQRPESQGEAQGISLELHDLAEHRVPAGGRRLVVRFFRTGGRQMMSMMGGSPEESKT